MNLLWMDTAVGRPGPCELYCTFFSNCWEIAGLGSTFTMPAVTLGPLGLCLWVSD